MTAPNIDELKALAHAATPDAYDMCVCAFGGECNNHKKARLKLHKVLTPKAVLALCEELTTGGSLYQKLHDRNETIEHLEQELQEARAELTTVKQKRDDHKAEYDTAVV